MATYQTWTPSRGLGRWRGWGSIASLLRKGGLTNFSVNQTSYSWSATQYIAIRSGDSAMLRELDFFQKSPRHLFTQWSDVDFLPIAREMDKIFKKKGWRK